MYPLTHDHIHAMLGMVDSGDFSGLRSYAGDLLTLIDAYDDANPAVCSKCGGRFPIEEVSVYHGDTYCIQCAKDNHIPLRWQLYYPRHTIATELYCMLNDLEDKYLDDDLIRGRIREAEDNLDDIIQKQIRQANA